MTEEQRLEDLKLNPRVVTNKQEKGKMKFLQKYYHRGAFYMDEENELMKVLYAVYFMLFCYAIRNPIYEPWARRNSRVPSYESESYF